MKIIALFSISCYQRISPLKKIFTSFSFLSNRGCRYCPTCGQYTYSAIEKYGIIKGVCLGIKRILRCNPFFKGGFDPIP